MRIARLFLFEVNDKNALCAPPYRLGLRGYDTFPVLLSSFFWHLGKGRNASHLASFTGERGKPQGCHCQHSNCFLVVVFFPECDGVAFTSGGGFRQSSNHPFCVWQPFSFFSFQLRRIFDKRSHLPEGNSYSHLKTYSLSHRSVVVTTHRSETA
jgi:hypothetical protein